MRGLAGVARVAAVTALAVASSCTLKDQSAPSLVGPSEFGLSINLTASPDSVIRDGASQTRVEAWARDENARPKVGLSMRLAIECVTELGRQIADFGTLSAKTVATGSDGKAVLTYTAPPETSPLDQFCIYNTVWVTATPILDNDANQTVREVQIRLVPPGIIVPPSNLAPVFTYLPVAPTEGQAIAFDATESTGAIATYAWTFGDGSTATGSVVSHTYNSAKSYEVTLTVADAVGRAVSTTQIVNVGPGTAPTAKFTYSPTGPKVNGTVYFNGSGSTAASGRTITGYSWDFGDGGSASGATPSHAFAAAGSYNVTLTVTDDIGKTGSTTTTIAVTAPTGASASFTYSPTGASVGQEIRFDGSASTASEGATVTAWAWDFGDGNTETGQTTRHTYRFAGTFTVRLTITDSAGKTASTTSSLTVSSGLTAAFTQSPTAAAIGQTVFFNASTSTAAAGRTIVSYTWDYGNGTTATFATPTGASTSYAATGTFTITLTITDDLGNTATKSATITIS